MTKTSPSTTQMVSRIPCLLLILCQSIGNAILSFFQSIGAMAMFVGIAIKHTVAPRFYPKLILKQFIESEKVISKYE